MTFRYCKKCPALFFDMQGTPCCQYNFPDEPIPVSSFRVCPKDLDGGLDVGLKEDYEE